MAVFPASFERVAGNLLSVDGSATQLPAILLDADSPLCKQGIQSLLSKEGDTVHVGLQYDKAMQRLARTT